MLRFFGNDTGQQQDGDQVGDCHECIQGIGHIPHKIQTDQWPCKQNEDVQDAVNREGFASK